MTTSDLARSDHVSTTPGGDHDSATPEVNTTRRTSGRPGPARRRLRAIGANFGRSCTVKCPWKLVNRTQRSEPPGPFIRALAQGGDGMTKVVCDECGTQQVASLICRNECEHCGAPETKLTALEE